MGLNPPPDPRGPASLIALTMGDPAGIGPEIVAKALREPRWRERCVVVGDAAVMQEALREHAPELRLRVCTGTRFANEQRAPDEALLYVSSTLGRCPPMGVVSAEAGMAAYAAVETAAMLCLDGHAAAMATAPISKLALRAAGVNEPGHTEILARLANTARYGMLFASERLNVILVTIHQPLRQAIASLSSGAILEKIELARDAARWLPNTKPGEPRIAVAGLNPHAGEGGMLGTEDDAIVAPAVTQAVAQGIDVTGPVPPDTVFMRAFRGEFDVVVALYHDQGLIPVKLLGIERAVNVTVGLPFLRTSVDHGTAFDIAGRGVADPANLLHVLGFTEQAIAARA